MLKLCAYCNKSFEKLTREHVLPKALLSKHFNNSSGYSNKSESFTTNYQIAHDVCKSCNGSFLSQLDDKFIKFYDHFYTQLSKEISGSTIIPIKYDYDSLTKFVIKTLYNSERALGYKNLPKIASNFREHIIGTTDLKNHFQLYIELLNPIKLTPSESIKYPILSDYTKISRRFKIGTGSNNSIIFKYFIFCELAFYLLPIDPTCNKSAVVDQFTKSFTHSNGDTFIKLLDPTEQFILITPSRRTIIDIVNNSINGELPETEIFFTQKPHLLRG